MLRAVRIQYPAIIYLKNERLHRHLLALFLNGSSVTGVYD